MVLRAYLDGWLPIMGRYNGRILFVDGFAGPGQYEGGEEGSPVIALKALIEHNAKRKITAEVVYLFIEADSDRAKHLQELISSLAGELPKNASVSVVPESFENAMTEALDALEVQGERMAPALVMIDPFGIKGVPMEVVRRILGTPRCEVYISFMYENMNRFLGTGEFGPHLDDLFGTDEWRAALDLEGDERRRFLYGLYARQLREAGAQHVLHFDLYKEARLVYAIFFGSQHERGCDLMKQCIWRVAPAGGFAFRGTRSEQLALDVEQPDFEPLKAQLVERFGLEKWVSIQDILSFVCSDQTDYHSGQVKRPVLRPMEAAGQLEVDDDSRNKRGTYPDGCRLRFTSRPVG